MPIVERWEFPRRHKIKDTAILIFILAAVVGFFFARCNSIAQNKRVTIHSVRFEEQDRSYVRLNYAIENSGPDEEKIDLLARAYDTAGQEVTSRLFQVKLPPGKHFRSVELNKFNRPLQEGEKLTRATLEIRKKKLLGF